MGANPDMEQTLHKLCKELRKEASAISLRKILDQLDKSDQMLMATKIRQVIDDLLYIQVVCEARCSVVIEMHEYMGGSIPTSKN